MGLSVTQQVSRKNDRRCHMMKLCRWIIGGALASTFLLGAVAMAAETAQPNAPTESASVYKTVGLGAAAAFAVAVSILGAGYAVGRIGSAALGAAAEKPELLTRSIPIRRAGGRTGCVGFAIG
jgi:V/A-type H+-transporting ATPase subunit K